MLRNSTSFTPPLGLIAGICVSDDGLLLATIAMDKTMKIYDVINFGMYPDRLATSYPGSMRATEISS